MYDVIITKSLYADWTVTETTTQPLAPGNYFSIFHYFMMFYGHKNVLIH